MFGKLTDLWLADVRATCRAATFKSYSGTVRQLFAFRPDLRDRAITRADLLAFRDARAAVSSAWSANRAVRTIKACLSFAAACQLGHPAVQTRRLLLPVEQRSDAAWTAAEVRRVLDAARFDPPVLVVLRVCAATGLRLGEALNLHWADVDFAGGTVRVNAKPDWTPKTRAALREVRAPELVAWLEAFRAAPTDYVCGRWNYPSSSRVHARIRAVYAQAGVPLRARPTHGMRHALALDLVASGVAINAAQAVLGHASAATTLGIYARARRADVVEAGDRLEAWRRRAG